MHMYANFARQLFTYFHKSSQYHVISSGLESARKLEYFRGIMNPRVSGHSIITVKFGLVNKLFINFSNWILKIKWLSWLQTFLFSMPQRVWLNHSHLDTEIITSGVIHVIVWAIFYLFFSSITSNEQILFGEPMVCVDDFQATIIIIYW